jgi:hypothetical protein
VQLLGPNVCLTHQQFVTKLPDASEQRSDIPFHQDNGYGRLEPPLDLTVWVALVDTDERNGCLWIVPGSHRLGLLDHGADSLRHITLTAGENTVHAHPRPSDRQLREGDILLTDFGGNFFGFSSDMARVGIVGKASQRTLDEYARYREVYVKLLRSIRPASAPPTSTTSARPSTTGPGSR